VLVLIRTGMARLNNFLYRIGAAESNTCVRGQAAETIGYFLFRIKFNIIYFHPALLRNINNTSFLGGKAAPDGDKWAPDMQAVRATIKFVIATGRLDI
ncbi:uncharacterized protein BKA55DRAFT_490776, partial [Fusarium redolens]